MLLCGCSRFPFPVATCMYYLLLISSLFNLALAGDIAFFFYRVRNVVFNACMCMHVCMYVKYIFVCIPHRDMCHILSGMVRSINTIFQDNTEQYVMLCYRCQKVKLSRPYSPEGNSRTVDPLDVHTATISLEH